MLLALVQLDRFATKYFENVVALDRRYIKTSCKAKEIL